MATVANQKTININKEKSDKQHNYSIYNLDALQKAMQTLKGETFKLWCYLNKNQAGYTFGLSKVDALSWGIGSSASYARAVKELIDLGYLVETSSNHYDFYEKPIVKDELIITKVDIKEEKPQFKL